ncbi:MAG: type IV pilin protein [Terriglobales bacterium]
MQRQYRQRGFSLIEVLIVVSIILLLAAISIPSFLRSRMAANEASAVSAIKTINTAQIGYAAAYPWLGYADSLTKLGAPPAGNPPDSDHAGYLDWVLGCPAQPCPKSGYIFRIADLTGNPVANFRVLAVPQTVGVTGIRGFCSNQLSTITYDPDGGSNCTEDLQ